jgi:transposase
MIVVGIDPHKASHTVCAIDAASGELAGQLTVTATDAGHQQLLAFARQLAGERRFAIEDCRHVSRRLERFLLLAGEQLVRVAPRLTARERARGRERGKSDRIDALAAARACLAQPGLPAARLDGDEHELALLCDYREQLVTERTRWACRLRWLLHDLAVELAIPPAGLSRRRWQQRLKHTLDELPHTAQTQIARQQLSRLTELSQEIHALEQTISATISQLAPRLLQIPGCGPLTAAKILTEIAGIDRFPTDAQLAMHAGVAPLQASSGSHHRHRLNRGGNRQLNAALHRIALTQARHHPETRAYITRHQQHGKTRREALRAYKRHLARTIHTTLTTPHLT